MSKFADLHCHPGLHPFAYDYVKKKRNENVWDRDPPKPKQRKSKFPEYTQSDFRTMAKGGVKLAVVSVYPIEQGWFRPKIIGDGILTDVLARIISRLPIKFVNKVQSDNFKYWDFFKAEYEFMYKEDKKPHGVDGEVYRYIIMKPGEDFNDLFALPNTIVAVMSVEGAQSLIPNNANEINAEAFDFDDTIANVKELKTWDSPPFFISLCHHFYNGLCGHARSFPGIAGKALDQEKGINEPLNDKGRELIDCFLGINDYEGNGQRILIDTKHMSVRARQEYYGMIRDLNTGKSDPEKIPIVVSHTGYSGNPELGADLDPDDSDDKYDTSTTFNNWSINLFDDEIIEIFNSNGIIGLNFDERILSGKHVMQEYEENFQKKEIKNRSEELQEFWANQMLKNILAIVGVVVNSDQVDNAEKVKAWDMISIGTDFDGMINAEDAYITSEEFIDFRNMLKNILDGQNNDHLLQGLSVDQVLDKIMYDNVANFVKMYY